MKNSRQIAVIAAIFVAVQLLSISFMYVALSPANQVFPNPDDPLIAIYYLVMLLGFTLLFLVLVKFDLDKVIKAIFFVSTGFVVFFIATALAVVLTADILVIWIAGLTFGGLSIIGIWRYPEWWVIDSVGLAMAIGVIALLGLSLSIIPILILLIALAVYDFIAVYRTKHMLTLAEGVTEMGLPILIVIPKKLPYSHIGKKLNLKAKPEEKKEREAFIVGLGDIIIPGLLAASAFWFIQDANPVFGIPSNLLIAIGSIVGGAIGLIILMRIVAKGNPQAGLPLLNSGAILGFLVTYLLVFGFNFSHIG